MISGTFYSVYFSSDQMLLNFELHCSRENKKPTPKTENIIAIYCCYSACPSAEVLAKASILWTPDREAEERHLLNLRRKEATPSGRAAGLGPPAWALLQGAPAAPINHASSSSPARGTHRGPGDGCGERRSSRFLSAEGLRTAPPGGVLAVGVFSS